MREDDRRLDNCLKCADCNTSCPVSKVYPDYPGPKALGPDLERLRKEGIKSDSEWLEYCLGCHRCELVCPHGVNVSELITNAKARHKKTGRRALRDHLFARPGLLGQLCSCIPTLSNFMLNLRPNRWLMSQLVQITPKRRLPGYHSKPLRPVTEINNASNRVLFFPGCFIRYNNPELGQNVIELLRLNGFAVEVAPATCCGVPAMANGDGTEAIDCVRQNVAHMLPLVEQGTRIVTACSSCGYALKADYPRLSASDPELAASAQRISSSTYDLAELLAGLLDAGKLKTNFKTTSMKLAYHAPCHLKSQGIGRPWLQLLRAVPGIEIEEIRADCCGMSGTYGFKQEKYQISEDIGKELFDRIVAYRPELVVTECASCQMQIEHGTPFEVRHPAEVMLRAYETQDTCKPLTSENAAIA